MIEISAEFWQTKLANQIGRKFLGEFFGGNNLALLFGRIWLKKIGRFFL